MNCTRRLHWYMENRRREQRGCRSRHFLGSNQPQNGKMGQASRSDVIPQCQDNIRTRVGRYRRLRHEHHGWLALRSVPLKLGDICTHRVHLDHFRHALTILLPPLRDTPVPIVWCHHPFYAGDGFSQCCPCLPPADLCIVPSHVKRDDIFGGLASNPLNPQAHGAIRRTLLNAGSNPGIL